MRWQEIAAATVTVAAVIFLRWRKRRLLLQAVSSSVASFVVPARNDQRAGGLLCSTLPRLFPSRKNAKDAIRRGQVLVGGVPITSDETIIKGGDRVDYVLGQAKVHKARQGKQGPPALELTWAHADDHLIVCVKPPGISVQGDESASRLRYAIAWHFPPPPHLPDSLSAPRHVHRIDKMTGGLLVFARNTAALSSVTQAFAAHDDDNDDDDAGSAAQPHAKAVQKTYLAIVAGKPDGEEGVVDAPIQGRRAVSRWRVLSSVRSAASGFVTTLRLDPQTGRNHQLRKHLALELGCPILGDPKYLTHEARAAEYEMHLWASELVMEHPATGAPLRVVADEPAHFEQTRQREAAAAAEMGEAEWAEEAERSEARRRRAASMQPSVAASARTEGMAEGSGYASVGAGWARSVSKSKSRVRVLQ